MYSTSYWLLAAFVGILLPGAAIFLLFYKRKGGKSAIPYALALVLVLTVLALVLGSGIAHWTEDSSDLLAAAYYGLLPGLSIVMTYYAVKSKQSFTAYYSSLGATLFTLVALIPVAAAGNTYPGGGWYAFVNYGWPDYWGSGSPEFAILAILVSLFIVVPKLSRRRARL
jgi:hypothetical protein